LKRFSKALKTFRVTAEKATDETLGKFAVELFGAVIRDTPVDEGRLRHNWTLSKGKPDVSIFAGTDINKPMFDLLNMRFDFGNDYYLSNNLPYARTVEFGLYPKKETDKVTSEGYSKKAPQGMMRRNVARAERILRRSLK